MRSSFERTAAILGAVLFASSPALANPQTTTTTSSPNGPDVTVINPSAPQTDETVTDNWNAQVFMSGAILFGITYGGSVIAAGTSDNSDDDRLFVPVLGPWLDLNDRGDCPVSEQSCDTETSIKVILVADGVLQAAGVLTMASALIFPSHHTRSVTTVSYKGLDFAPARVGDTGRGLSMSGTF